MDQRDFDRRADAWLAHCEANSAASDPNVYLNDPSFDALVALGEPAVPLIIERYRNGSLFWGAVLARITGRTEFGNGLTGRLTQTKQGWLSWWGGHGRRP